MYEVPSLLSHPSTLLRLRSVTALCKHAQDNWVKKRNLENTLPENEKNSFPLPPDRQALVPIDQEG